MTVRAIVLGSILFALSAGEGSAQLFGQQRDDGELIARIGRLENQIRQLTGMLEELQHRNTQLEQQMQRMQQDTEFRFQEIDPSGRAPGRAAGAAPSRAAPGVAAMPDTAKGTQSPGGRGDAFDPTANPDAPGVPRQLGTIPGGAGDPSVPPIAAPGAGDGVARAPGVPLDLGALAGSAPDDRIAPGRAPAGSVGQQASAAPSANAKDEFDLGYGAILRRDYELADETFRRFLATHGRDPVAPEAQRLVHEAYFWLGESLFQRKMYNDAAETFLDLNNKFPNAVKAPDALLRLGQSLAAIGQKDYACASFSQVAGKYPRAPDNVKRAVEQEQKRARC